MLNNIGMESLCNNLKKPIKSFNKLTSLQKIVFVFLILVFAFIIINNFGTNKNYYNYYENYKNNNKNNFQDTILDQNNYFEVKRDDELYDDFYSRYYDSIHLNKKKNNFEIGKIIDLEKKTNNTKILDVGCGTGYHVNQLTNKSYDIVGLDQSKDMIVKAQDKYPKCEFVEGNILNNNIFDYGSFSHVMCLGRTLYLIKNKAQFFENCHSLLADRGLLIVDLAERNSFKPFVSSGEKNVLYDPEKYGKPPMQLIVKFNKDLEFISDFEKNKNFEKDSELPYATFKEKFKNFNTNSVRKNELDMYILEASEIVNIAKSKGFELYKKISMSPVNYGNENLYVFRK